MPDGTVTLKTQTAINPMYRWVRDLSRKIATYVSPQLDTTLADAGLYAASSINGIYFGLVDLHGACDIMEHDLRTRGGLIYTAPEQLAPKRLAPERLAS